MAVKKKKPFQSLKKTKADWKGFLIDRTITELYWLKGGGRLHAFRLDDGRVIDVSDKGILGTQIDLPK